MIAIGSRILPASTAPAGPLEANLAWGPAIRAAAAGQIDLTFLHRHAGDLPRHVLKRRHPRLVVVLDAPLAPDLHSPGPSSWRSSVLWHRLRPTACFIDAAPVADDFYQRAVSLTRNRGLVLGITCSPDRVADWDWLVRPWCRLVRIHDPNRAFPDRRWLGPAIGDAA